MDHKADSGEARAQERNPDISSADVLWLAAMAAVLCGLLILALQA